MKLILPILHSASSPRQRGSRAALDSRFRGSDRKQYRSDSSCNSHRFDGGRGYTLIEFIIVITVVAVIGLSVVAVMMYGLDLWAKIQEQAQARRTATSFLELVTRQLQQGELPTWAYSLSGSPTISFKYDYDKDGLEEDLTYYLDATSGEIRRTVDEAAEYEVIATGVASLGFTVSGENKLITIDLEMTLSGGRTMKFSSSVLPRSSWPEP